MRHWILDTQIFGKKINTFQGFTVLHTWEQSLYLIIGRTRAGSLNFGKFFLLGLFGGAAFEVISNSSSTSLKSHSCSCCEGNLGLKKKLAASVERRKKSWNLKPLSTRGVWISTHPSKNEVFKNIFLHFFKNNFKN